MSFKWRGMSDDGETITLRRFAGQFSLPAYATTEWMQNHRELLSRGVVIDVETTGIDRSMDSVIEVGLRQFTFHRTQGDLLAVGKSYSGLQDPLKPLDPEISRLTGIIDEDLRGKSIDWDVVERAIAEADIIIAHNAAFDRPFIDRHVQVSAQKLWGCSYRQVDWIRKGYFNQKLEQLCVYHGFFTHAHRALNDADALLNLLSMEDEGAPYLRDLVHSAQRPMIRATATRSPFESKDLLKTRGYRWDSPNRVWRKTLAKEGLKEEVSWLEAAVYHGPFLGSIDEIPAVDQFK